MKISSSFNAGIMGLYAQSSRLATISQNIANSQTNGFKRLDTEFSSLVTNNSAVLYQAGGVRPNTIREVSDNGSILGTDNALDIAVSDRGLLPVTDMGSVDAGVINLPFKLTTTGSFRPDANGYMSTANGTVLMGWPADQNGVVTPGGRTDSGSLEPIQIEQTKIEAQPTTNMTVSLNLPASATVAGASGAAQDLDLTYFDNLGSEQTLTFRFTPTVPATGSSNAWSVEVIDSATATASNPIADFDMTFYDTQANGGTLNTLTVGTGVTYNSATGELALTTANGPMTIDIGSPAEVGRMTQLDADFRPTSIAKDGAGPSDMSGVSIDRNGFVVAQFESGATRVLYQVPLVDVPNPDGLMALDGQMFAISRESGEFYLWDANTGPVGSTLGFSLEQSSVDLAQELTSLIQTQRAYSSNTKIIETVDRMLEETTNLKR
ncbi:MAG: flagellar hook-basal body complex protein [Pseudomonadota bacterium]